MKLLLFFALLGLSACASKPLTSEEAAVRILRKSDAPKECKELGKVNAFGIWAVNEQQKDDELKRNAFKLGANTVTVDGVGVNNETLGTAFHCP